MAVVGSRARQGVTGALAPGRRGRAVRQAADVHEPERGSRRRATRFYKIDAADLLVVSDDVNLPLGRLRARASGSEGGHNGLRSIAEQLGTTDYARLRVGVGRGDIRRDLADHVLARFEPDERSGIEDAIARAADAVETWLDDGLAKMMNIFNRAEDDEGAPCRPSRCALVERPDVHKEAYEHCPSVRADLHHATRDHRGSARRASRADRHRRRAFGGRSRKPRTGAGAGWPTRLAGHREGVYVLEVINGPAALPRSSIAGCASSTSSSAT